MNLGLPSRSLSEAKLNLKEEDKNKYIKTGGFHLTLLIIVDGCKKVFS